MSGYAGRRTAGIAVALLAVVIARYGYDNFGWFFVHVALPELPIRSFTWLLTFSSCCVVVAIVAALMFVSYRLLRRPVSDGKNINRTTR